MDFFRVPCLEDHPHDLDTWLLTMVIISPLSRVVGPLPNGLNGFETGATRHLRTGMIFQAASPSPNQNICRDFDRWVKDVFLISEENVVFGSYISFTPVRSLFFFRFFF